jgi:hypothetical protein
MLADLGRLARNLLGRTQLVSVAEKLLSLLDGRLLAISLDRESCSALTLVELELICLARLALT